jgi:hypothetical protein
VIGKRFEVGDVIQFENASFRSGRLIRHHTQIVASVDANGRVTRVFEQNVGGRRTVQRNVAVDLAGLTGGMVTIYRPSPRVNRPGRFEFTVVNNTMSPQTYTRRSGAWSATASLDRANTVGSYKYYWSTFSPGVAASLEINGSSVPIRNAAAYELYTTTRGQVAIRQVL